jgi:hypothetical protein
MKVQLIEIGRDKVSRTVDVADERSLRVEIKKHLASRYVELDWCTSKRAIVRVGRRVVGEVAFFES